MAGEHWVDQLSKALAHSQSRKQFLQIAGSALAALLAPGALSTPDAAAQDGCPQIVADFLACLRRRIEAVPPNRQPTSTWQRDALAAADRLGALICGFSVQSACKQGIPEPDPDLRCTPGDSLKDFSEALSKAREMYRNACFVVGHPYFVGTPPPPLLASAVVPAGVLQFTRDDPFGRDCLLHQLIAACVDDVIGTSRKDFGLDDPERAAEVTKAAAQAISNLKDAKLGWHSSARSTGPGGGGGSGCPSGRTDCGGVCVDTSTDRQNCGGCADSGGQVCGSNQVCRGGACACRVGFKSCGSACIPESGCCGRSECASKPGTPFCCDNHVCQECCPEAANRQCPSGKVCQNGHCECPTGSKLCGTTCINATDCCSADCPIPGQTCLNGACACPSGQTVVNGRCEGPTSCPTGQVSCNGACVTLGTNQHCSACGDACTGGKTCQSRTCACPSGRVDCNGTCCPSGEICQGGQCGVSCGSSGFCPDTAVCCPLSQNPFSGGVGICCEAGSVCQAVACCPADRTLQCSFAGAPGGIVCCPSTFFCCPGGGCCPPGDTCCPDGCCGPGSICAPGGGCQSL
jgi:hypothetical protein